MVLFECMVSFNFRELSSGAYFELQLQRRRVYSADLGYVSREVGIHGHLLEFCGCPFRESMKSLIQSLVAHVATDLRLFGCLHGLT